MASNSARARRSRARSSTLDSGGTSTAGSSILANQGAGHGSALYHARREWNRHDDKIVAGFPVGHFAGVVLVFSRSSATRARVLSGSASASFRHPSQQRNTG